MSSEESRSQRPARRSKSASRVRVTATQSSHHGRPEVRRRGSWVEVTLHAPYINEGKFRYALKRRYLIVWNDGSPHTQHQMVYLPHAVEPQEFQISFLNGVVDARIRVRKTG